MEYRKLSSLRMTGKAHLAGAAANWKVCGTPWLYESEQRTFSAEQPLQSLKLQVL